ncbi:tetratricopeptide repeat protein [Halalkalibaculum sp. DA3122]
MGLDQLSAYSIYYENYKNEEYEGAIRYGRWIYKAMPKKLKGYSRFDLERNLNRLITAYSEVAMQKQDPSERSAYLDTAQVIFEKVYNEFGEDEIDMFEWKFKEARFLQENSDFIDDAMTRAYGIYLDLFEQDPEKFTQSGDGYYVQVTLQHLVNEEQKDKALDMIEKAEPHAPNDKLLAFFDTIRNKLFDSPKERIAFLESQLEQNPDSTAILQDLADLYDQQGQMDKVREIRNKLYEVNPNFENTRALADYAINNANYDEAIRYLKEALDKTDDQTEKARVALDISDAYLNKENLQQARSFARQAMNLDSSSGQPYMQMASIYSQAVSQCTGGRKMDRKDKVVYWLVLDYLDRARQTDSSLSSQVQNQYQSYQPVTPTTEEKFMWDPNPLEEGQEIEVGGNLHSCYEWIGETTTVR